ncbi:hypothetical protein [Lentzea albida]|uniref:Universal stress protein family protein n=1 Tax=Lentzea albida TaxID=65499 RepID=A0A1H9MPK2_9PSEU|nr:hypothetical protein [Lentzea albida]SER25626.1 hypothetical protein SAMN04488000_107151 [Lentzea albida]
MTAVTGGPALTGESAPTATTCVLVDVRDSGVTGVRWAAGCAEALGVDLVVHTGAEDDPVHTEVAALLAERPELTVHVEHGDRYPPATEGALVVLSRQRALDAPPLACRDRRDVVVVGGSATALAGRFGVVTAVVERVGGEGVLERATALCRARGATRLRVLARPSCPLSGGWLDDAADVVHACCPGVIVELVRQGRSVAEETRLFPSDLLVVSGRERGPGEGLQPDARAALHHASCPVLFSCS